MILNQEKRDFIARRKWWEGKGSTVQHYNWNKPHWQKNWQNHNVKSQMFPSSPPSASKLSIAFHLLQLKATIKSNDWDAEISIENESNYSYI